MGTNGSSNGMTLLLLGLLLLGAFLFLRKPPVAQSSNEETWEWTDWQGNKRQAIVHRQVKQE